MTNNAVSGEGKSSLGESRPPLFFESIWAMSSLSMAWFISGGEVFEFFRFFREFFASWLKIAFCSAIFDSRRLNCLSTSLCFLIWARFWRDSLRYSNFFLEVFIGFNESFFEKSCDLFLKFKLSKMFVGRLFSSSLSSYVLSTLFLRLTSDFVTILINFIGYGVPTPSKVKLIG